MLPFTLISASFVLFGLGMELARVTMPSKGKTKTRGAAYVLPRTISSRCANVSLHQGRFGFPPAFGLRGVFIRDSRFVHAANSLLLLG